MILRSGVRAYVHLLSPWDKAGVREAQELDDNLPPSP